MGKIVEIKCFDCGCTFTAQSKGRKYCDNCRENRKNLQKKIYIEKKKEKRKKEKEKIAAMRKQQEEEKKHMVKMRKKKSLSISEIAAEAREHGMTYGQYVMFMENNK